MAKDELGGGLPEYQPAEKRKGPDEEPPEGPANSSSVHTHLLLFPSGPHCDVPGHIFNIENINYGYANINKHDPGSIMFFFFPSDFRGN